MYGLNACILTDKELFVTSDWPSINTLSFIGFRELYGTLWYITE